MPMADQFSEHGRLVRCLAYGRDKTKKSWWAMRAAEAGYNTIVFDGDDGASIVRQLSVEARKKILILNVVDIVERPVFCRFMASFLRPGNTFLWDEDAKASIPVTHARNPEHSYVLFQPSKLTTNDVIIIDSWTALVDSTKIEWAKENNVDLTAVEREGDQFSLFNYQARFLDYCLNKIHTLPCHVIVIGHEQEWEKFKGTGKDRKVVGSFTQPISSTGPQGQKLGKHFSEVLHFRKLNDLLYQIDTGGDENKAGGSRTLAPKKYKWEEVTPKLLFEAIGAHADAEAKSEGAIYIPPGGEMPKIANLVVAKTAPNPPSQIAVPAQPTVVNAGNANVNVSLLSKLKKS